MPIAFFSECPKTLLSKRKVHFIHQGIKKCNFYFAFFDIFSAFLWFLSHFFNIHSKTIKITKYLYMGTWLSAAIYYCENYQLIKSIVMGFDKEDAVAIENAQKLLNDNNLELNLTFIKANYGNLAKYITTLETSGLSLADAINIIAQVQNEIGTDNSSIGKSIKKKLEVVIEKNSGFKTMKHISNILEEKATSRNNTIPEELTADDMAHLKFAPMTSVDVERSFSRYKTTLADNRRRFLFENIKQHLIIQCYETKGKKNEEEDGQEDN